MTDNTPPKIGFPCRYPIKVIGEATIQPAQVVETVRRHAPEVTPDDVSTRQSRQKNYISVRINIIATSETQLQALHQELMQQPNVKMVL